VLLAVLVLLLMQPPSDSIASLHDAAKWGDAAAAQRLLDVGADVNGLVSFEPQLATGCMGWGWMLK